MKEIITKALKESNEKMYKELVNTWWKKAVFWWIVARSKYLPK